MIDGYGSRFRDEIAELHRDGSDPVLDAVTVAIYVEDATGAILSDDELVQLAPRAGGD